MIDPLKTPPAGKKPTGKNRFGTIAVAGALALSLLAGCKHQPAPVDDATLNNNVQSKISGDSVLAGEPIQVSTANGVVTLNGMVDSDAARTLAGNDATQVAGVKVLNNNLTVQTAAGASAPASASALPATTATKKNKPSAAAPAPAPSPYQQAPAPIVQNAPPPPPPPPAPAKPVLRTVTLPAGTVLPIRTTEAMTSNATEQGSAFHGVIAADITDSNGNLAFANGTPVTGQVVTVQDAAHFKGSSMLTITLSSISFKGDHIPITTEAYSVQGKGRGKNTAEKIGGGAVIGAILGGILGGGKGAAVGAAAGGGIGAGTNAATKGQEVSIPSESLVRFKLTNAISVTR